jgi:hypothetical protein
VIAEEEVGSMMPSPERVCCEVMRDQLNHSCEQHPDAFDCPDQLVSYLPEFDEFGLIIHDGGQSCSAISFCPWCGSKLPESKRDRWFEELESLGLDPDDPQLPEKYRTDAWFRGS